MWAVGDWWAFGEHRYGERAAIVKSTEWEGPAFQTCVDAGVVCRRFESKSRDLLVSFRAHRAIAPIDDEQSRLKVLAWAAAEKRKFSELEAKVKETRAFLAQGWTASQLERKQQAPKMFGSSYCVMHHAKYHVGFVFRGERPPRKK